jgi:cytochrome c oxidase subunit 2
MLGPYISPLLGDAPDGLWFPEEASTFAGEVDGTFNLILYISLAFFVVIVAVMVWFPIRYRQPKGGKATSRALHNTMLEVSWSVFPCFLLVIMFVRGSWGYLDMREPPAGATEVNVTAFRWGWNFDYGKGITSNELHVVKGQPTKLIMRSTDVIHSLFIPSFRVKRDVVPGRYNLVWFEATVASGSVSESELAVAKLDAKENNGGYFNPERYGVDGGNGFTEHGYRYFDLFCTEYCGKDHSNMHSYVVVHETQEELDAWLVKINVKPADMTPEEYGQKLYNSKGCKSCHSVDGKAVVGPTFLNVFGSTHGLEGGGEVVVDENYVRESILNPMAKIVANYKGVMPSYKGQLTDEQLDCLIAYLKSLRQQ